MLHVKHFCKVPAAGRGLQALFEACCAKDALSLEAAGNAASGAQADFSQADFQRAPELEAAPLWHPSAYSSKSTASS
jgi:hypothetical protein